MNDEVYILKAGLQLLHVDRSNPKARLVDKLQPNSCVLVKIEALDHFYKHAMLIIIEKSTDQNAGYQYQLFDINYGVKLVTRKELYSTLAEMIQPYRFDRQGSELKLTNVTFMDIIKGFKYNSNLGSIEQMRSLIEDSKTNLLAQAMAWPEITQPLITATASQETNMGLITNTMVSNIS